MQLLDDGSMTLRAGIPEDVQLISSLRARKITLECRIERYSKEVVILQTILDRLEKEGLTYSGKKEGD